MNVRVAAAVILLFLITGAGISLVIYTARVCDDLITLSQTAAENYSLKMLSETETVWLKKADLLSCFIPHDHIDRITESFLKGSVYLEHGCLEEYSAEMQSIIAGLTVLKYYDIPTTRSVF